jgi:hypothetical protein
MINNPFPLEKLKRSTFRQKVVSIPERFGPGPQEIPALFPQKLGMNQSIDASLSGTLLHMREGLSENRYWS